MSSIPIRYFLILIHCSLSLVGLLLCGLSLKFEWASINQCTYIFEWLSGKGTLFIDEFNGVFGNLPFDFDLGDNHWMIPIPKFPGGGAQSFIDSDQVRTYIIKQFALMLVGIGLLALSIFPFGTVLYKRLPYARVLFALPLAFVVASVTIFQYQVVPWFKNNLYCNVEQDGLGLTLSYIAMAAICTNIIILIFVSLYLHQKRKKIKEDSYLLSK
ncbi:hypothetical protein PPL_00403 [Heterostelium album PN500]|uniref:Uncharacterized protein n=1 Tax=Heterostelium pallidum (strain ATCC 26659 / Pp 5 / PN500) TaxID=670386 RepID=D3AWC9_HETP5|nr:hypothetical protein PPL_00403 [Heterostelium album PN500]EFA86602.1 hypothetical protein PPL_00403 [Heterostelium album PN500]|eukprot:XP_020438707.1 hypothetical protein PPL_00403 [Heterostelium album PN500]